jgi:hypothetical protein
MALGCSASIVFDWIRYFCISLAIASCNRAWLQQLSCQSLYRQLLLDMDNYYRYEPPDGCDLGQCLFFSCSPRR